MNCYIVYNLENKNTVIIDPGDEIEIIKNFIEDNKLNVKIVLNTHGHIDHAGRVADFLKVYNVDYLIHKEDMFWIDKLQEQAVLFGLQVSEKPEPTRFLEDNQEIDCNIGEIIKVIHTPGHTPGSSCFHIGNHIFTGDTLFQGSIGRYDFPKSSYKEIMQSIKERLLKLDADTIVHPGHGEDTTIGIEKFTNPFLI